MPLHPFIVHLPLALAFLLPVLIIVVTILIQQNKMSTGTWFIVVGLQALLTVSGYVSLETGETDEEKVERMIEKHLIHEHEEAAEIFVGSTVILLALSTAVYFIGYSHQFKIRLLIGALSLISVYLAYDTGRNGSELVYVHGAAEAFGRDSLDATESPAGILPGDLPPAEADPDETESTKVDDNDYGGTEAPEVDEEVKAED